MVKIRPWQICIYTYLEWPSKKEITKSHYTTNTLSSPTTYTGFLTDSSLKNLRNTIKMLIAISKPKEAMNFSTGTTFTFRVNFITLTLSAPQRDHDDYAIKKKIFDPWLKKAKRWFGICSYIWRAERQQNQNIHFHLMTDTYIDHKQLRDSWNQSQQLLGFIDSFEKLHNHRHPNSTDIHAVKKIRDLAAYISKYMSKKGDGENKIAGKVWGCSQNLSKHKATGLIIDSRISDELKLIQEKFSWKKHTSEFATVYNFKEEEFKEAISGEMKKEWEKLLQDVRDHKEKNEEKGK